MANNVTLNGSTYSVPDVGEENWGQDVTNLLIAMVGGLLQKAGGSFTLTNEVDFGATYGLKSVYFKSGTSNPSSAGVLRCANNEGVGFRNAANDADLILKANASDLPEFDGDEIATHATVSKAEYEYLSGVTSAIQTQIDAKLEDPMTTDGDLIYQTSGSPARLAPGSDGLVLTMVSGEPAWSSVAGTGDVVGPGSSVDRELARFDGATGKLLQAGGSKMADGGAFDHSRTATAVSASSAGESIIAVTDTTAARTITLSDTDKIAGRTITVKDESGGAQDNNITVTPQTGTIDGESDFTIGKNYGSAVFYSDGSNWFTIAEDNVFDYSTFFEVSGDSNTGQNGDFTSGSPVVTNLTDTTAYNVGDYVYSSNLTTGGLIQSIDSATQVTLDSNATGTGTAVLLYYQNVGVIKASSGRLHYLHVLPKTLTDAELYIALYDKATKPDLRSGGDSPVLVLRLVTNDTTDTQVGNSQFNFMDGIPFSNGIAYAIIDGDDDFYEGALQWPTDRCYVNALYT